MSRAIKYALFFLLGGMLLAIHLSPHIFSVQRSPIPVQMPDGWISTAQTSHRGYFRQVLEVPFQPEHAWLSIAAEDYRLYVNGVQVARNTYLLRTGTAYQDKLSVPGQSLRQGDVFPRGGGAQVAKAAKREWRMVQFYDLRPHLKQGRNLLAVYVQSDRLDRLAIHGHAAGQGAQMEISGRASAWRARIEAITRNGLEWFDPLAEDLDWENASVSEPPEDLPLYAAANPDIWRQPFEPLAITSPLPGEEQIFSTALPLEVSGQRGWIRVWSSWPYDLFVGDEWVGHADGSNRVEAFDISAHLYRGVRQLSIRMQPGAGPSAALAEELPWLAVDGRIGSLSISTARDWRVLSRYHRDWLQGGGEWVAAAPHEHTAAPGPIRYQISQGYTWRWLGSWAGLWILLSLLLATAAWLLSRLKSESGGGGTQQTLGSNLAWSCWLLTPALIAISVQEALRFRFSESDALLIFLDPERGWLWLTTGPLLLLVSLGWLTRPEPPKSSELIGAVRKRIESLPTWFLLGIICLVGLALRLFALEFQPPSGDDYTSWAAARGILRSGVPEAASGILYTRSPLFHYLFAAWLGLFGDTLASARSFSLLPGILLIPAAYHLVFAITRRRLPAFVTALFLALDPWLMGISNLIRFYQLMQFFALLSVLFFLKGFIWREGKRAQNLFFVFATAAVLSQEVFATTFAAFLLAFLVCYRPFDWREDRNVWLGFAAMMLIIWLDIRTSEMISLTPHVALSTNSESLFVPHLVDVFGGTTNVLSQLATDFFWMNTGENALLSLLFFAGFVYWLRRADRTMLTLYAVVLVSIAILSVLVVPINARYAYGVYPIFVVAAILSAEAMIRQLAQSGSSRMLSPAAASRWSALVVGLMVAGWALNAEFDKLWRYKSGYRELDYRRAWDYIAAHKKPQDKLLSVRVAGGGVVFGRVDYYAMVGPAFDGIYQRRHAAVDRWSGGKLVWKVDQFRDVFLHHPRVWVIVDEPRWPSMNPGVSAFLRDCCSVQAEFFGGQVLLWERTAGRFSTAADQGGGADSF